MKSIARPLRPDQIESQKRRKQTLLYIRIYYEKRGEFPPTADIAFGTGYSLGTVQRHVRTLRKENLIPNTIRMSRKGSEYKVLMPPGLVGRAMKKARNTIFQYFERRCARCGFDDIRALQLDHVNGGGWKEVSKIGSYQMYKRLVLRIMNGEEIKDYQILCANCNWIKRHENGEQPRKGRRPPKFND